MFKTIEEGLEVLKKEVKETFPSKEGRISFEQLAFIKGMIKVLGLTMEEINALVPDLEE